MMWQGRAGVDSPGEGSTMESSEGLTVLQEEVGPSCCSAAVEVSKKRGRMDVEAAMACSLRGLKCLLRVCSRGGGAVPTSGCWRRGWGSSQDHTHTGVAFGQTDLESIFVLSIKRLIHCKNELIIR